MILVENLIQLLSSKLQNKNRLTSYEKLSLGLTFLAVLIQWNFLSFSLSQESRIFDVEEKQNFFLLLKKGFSP